MNTIGERIRMIRNNLSRQVFAEKYGIHVNSLERWENNKRQPREDFLNALISGEKITHSWLLLGEGPLHQTTPSETADSEKPATCRRKSLSTTVQGIENNKIQQNTTCDTSQPINSDVWRIINENADLLRENGDLRVDVERKKARIAELERELARVLKGEEATPLAGAG